MAWIAFGFVIYPDCSPTMLHPEIHQPNEVGRNLSTYTWWSGNLYHDAGIVFLCVISLWLYVNVWEVLFWLFFVSEGFCNFGWWTACFLFAASLKLPDMIYHEKIKVMKPCLELVILEVAVTSSDTAVQADPEWFNTLQLEHENWCYTTGNYWVRVKHAEVQKCKKLPVLDVVCDAQFIYSTLIWNNWSNLTRCQHWIKCPSLYALEWRKP